MYMYMYSAGWVLVLSSLPKDGVSIVVDVCIYTHVQHTMCNCTLTCVHVVLSSDCSVFGDLMPPVDS